jgi:HSP20 family molecular chaperone IbpA
MATLYNSMDNTAYLYALWGTVPQIMPMPKSDMSVDDSWQETAWDAALPPIKIAETAEGFVYTATLNGVSPLDVRVEVMQGYMSIRASFTAPAPYDNSANSVEYTREFALPSWINEQNARISFHNSVLTVMLPKAQRKIFGLF